MLDSYLPQATYKLLKYVGANAASSVYYIEEGSK